MDWELGWVFVNDLKQARGTCDFRAAYILAIASSSKDAIMSYRTLAEFQHVFPSPKEVVQISTCIDTVIQLLNRACALCRHSLRSVSLKLVSWPISNSTLSSSPRFARHHFMYFRLHKSLWLSY